MIHRTAVAVAQFPAGVSWSPGETVYLAVGIAATSDEHIAVLANLADVLQDVATAEALALTGDPQRILTVLNQPRAQAAPPDGADHPETQLHAQFYPPYRTRERLKYLAGTELAAGMFAMDVLPETTAYELQQVEVSLEETA